MILCLMCLVLLNTILVLIVVGLAIGYPFLSMIIHAAVMSLQIWNYCNGYTKHILPPINGGMTIPLYKKMNYVLMAYVM